MTSAMERYEFIDHINSVVPGWLYQGAGVSTVQMLEWQDQVGIKGSFLEIGVYFGRYFSILVRHARLSDSCAVGVDPFTWVATKEKTLDAIKSVVGDYPKAKLITAFSNDCDSDFLLRELEEKPRFISIDGSHDRDDVCWDLLLAEKLMGTGGIVAVDDFLNPVALGVNEAMHCVFSQPRRYVPWAFVQNKLFLSQPMFAQQYRSLLEKSLQDDLIGQHAKLFRDHAKESRTWVEGKLWGYPVLQVI